MNTTLQSEAQLTVRGALREALLELRKVPSHALSAELLLMHVLGCDRVWLYSHSEALLSSPTVRRFFDLLRQRAQGVPTQYLTGKQEFWGLEFEVTPAVLIPRPETEHLIEVAMERLGEKRRGDPLRVADVGTGSGCIAVALATELFRAKVVATDLSARALEVAKRNAHTHGVCGRTEFVQGDLLEGASLQEQSPFDLIVSNPPYLAPGEQGELPREVREHEPSEALFGGATGMEIYVRLIAQSLRHLRPGGLLVLEMGYGALGRVAGLVDRSAWREVLVTHDLAAIPRVLSAIRR